LQGSGPNADPLELPVAPPMGHPILRPQAPDDLDAFGQPADPLGHRDPEGGELLGPVAEPHPEQEASACHHVEEGADLRHLDRVVQGQ